MRAGDVAQPQIGQGHLQELFTIAEELVDGTEVGGQVGLAGGFAVVGVLVTVLSGAATGGSGWK